MSPSCCARRPKPSFKWDLLIKMRFSLWSNLVNKFGGINISPQLHSLEMPISINHEKNSEHGSFSVTLRSILNHLQHVYRNRFLMEISDFHIFAEDGKRLLFIQSFKFIYIDILQYLPQIKTPLRDISSPNSSSIIGKLLRKKKGWSCWFCDELGGTFCWKFLKNVISESLAQDEQIIYHAMWLY